LPLRILGAAGTVVNAGSIATTVGNYPLTAVHLTDGGELTNQATGTITGQYDGVNFGASGVIVNRGLIADPHSPTLHSRGVYLGGGGSLSNAATGVITAGESFS